MHGTYKWIISALKRREGVGQGRWGKAVSEYYNSKSLPQGLIVAPTKQVIRLIE